MLSRNTECRGTKSSQQVGQNIQTGKDNIFLLGTTNAFEEAANFGA